MGSFKYTFRDATRLIVRHWGLSLLTVLTSMSVFYLIGASVLLVLNTRHIVNIMEGELTIQAFLAPEASADVVAKRATTLSHVTKISIITPEIALGRLQVRVEPRMPNVLGFLADDNPLPWSIEISVDRADGVRAVADALSAMEGVSDVVYAVELAQKLANFSRFAGQFSVVMLLVAITASAVVLFNTIRISVYSKEEEIGIMLMVGATPTFVAMPFVIQGILLGGIGSLGASVLLSLSYNGIIERLKELLPFLPFLERGMLVAKLGVILVGSGATLSLIASLLAVEAFTRRAMKPL
ncbi:MAG: permease-like cell division protein FtsX [Synergistaceae bacterium]|jgi:cell division transport system permease protein|nr:permease-like cell division protein FtsX [Synergistaceae bacterium]